MIFLIVLFVAWAILVLPDARRARFSGPWMSARRYRASMMLVAPHTRADIRRATRREPNPRVERTRSRRREVMVFLTSGAVSAAVVAVLANRPGAWPVAALFAALLLMYVAAIAEVDRRRVARRIARRRAERERARFASRGPDGVETFALASGDA